MIERPSDRVMVERTTRRDGSVRCYTVRVWYPFEGWGVVADAFDTEPEANDAADALRLILNEEPCP